MTWHQALKDAYSFNMGDHGSILTAVKYFHGNAKTRHILFSTDEGEKWSQAVFYNQEIRLYGLMTEPGENTTIFTMFGSASAVHQWIIIKVDMRGVFSYNCSKVCCTFGTYQNVCELLLLLFFCNQSRLVISIGLLHVVFLERL